MSLYDELKSKASEIDDMMTDLQKEADSIDDDFREIDRLISSNKCETAEEYSDLLDEIQSKLEDLRGRIY